MGRTRRAPEPAVRLRLRQAIGAYIRSHPNASDTLGGITGWWLPPGVAAPPGEIEMALEDLVREGMLERTRLPDGTPLYSGHVRRGTGE